MTRNFYKYILLLMVAVLPLFVSAAGRSVELRVEPASRSGVIEVGQKFYIKIIVSNVDGTPSAPSSVPGAKVQYFGHQSSSSSFTSINGQTSQSVVNVYAVTLKAERKGKFTFGPVTVGGVKSNTVNYTIAEAGSAPDPYSSPQHSGASSPQAGSPDPSGQGPQFIGKGNEQLFLRANVSKTTCYEQEALVYTVKLYTTYGTIKFIGATDAPKFDGFVIEESSNVSNQLTYETYNGRTYATAIIARYIIFPQKAGKLKILGNKYTVSADAEEYYHDPFFSTLTVRRPVQLNVTPNDLEVTARPLPMPRPVNFSGGVGKFTIASNLKSQNEVANQAASISYLVTGEGNLKYIHLPDLNVVYPDEIEVFTPSTDVKTVVGSSNVSGSVNFDYSFMPLEQGKFTLPAVELVYFNPATGKYETSVSRSYTINVAAGSESSRSQATLVFDSSLMQISGVTGNYRPWVESFPYWLWYIIPSLLLAATLIARRKYIVIQADVWGRRSKNAGKVARKRLRRAMDCIRKRNEDAFYDEMLTAMWGYVADKLKLPTSELNRENAKQILADRNIQAQDIEAFLKLLDECEFAKYSPASSRRGMKAVYTDATQIINSMEDDFDASPKSDTVNDDERDIY